MNSLFHVPSPLVPVPVPVPVTEHFESSLALLLPSHSLLFPLSLYPSTLPSFYHHSLYSPLYSFLFSLPSRSIAFTLAPDHM